MKDWLLLRGFGKEVDAKFEENQKNSKTCIQGSQEDPIFPRRSALECLGYCATSARMNSEAEQTNKQKNYRRNPKKTRLLVYKVPSI